MKLFPWSALAPVCFFRAVLANVEKAIFLGPETPSTLQQYPTLSDLHIDILTPFDRSLRTHVTTTFPSHALPSGTATWLLLNRLSPGQRYEVRTCWAATQPTTFILDTYEFSRVWETPGLISSLTGYSSSRQPAGGGGPPGVHHDLRREELRVSSFLLLRILAAADYFTDNATLMNNVPPVYIDIILDTYILNILPESLIPTVIYIVFMTLVSGATASVILGLFRCLLHSGDETTKKKN